MTTQNSTFNRVEYHVTIDRASPLSNIHALAAQAFVKAQTPTGADEQQASNKDGHPVLYCAELDFRHPAMLRALVHIPADRDTTIFWIPYSHVLGILELHGAKPGSKEDSDESMSHTAEKDDAGGLESASSGRYH